MNTTISPSQPADSLYTPSVCIVGPWNLALLVDVPSSRALGGAERQQTLLALELAKQGVDVSMIVYAHPEAPKDINGIQILQMCDEHARTPIPYFGILHPQMSSLWRALKTANPDIIHTTCAGPFTAVAALYAKIYGKKSVYRMASDEDAARETMLVDNARDRSLAIWGMKQSSLVVSQNTSQKDSLKQNFNVDSVILKSLMAFAVEPCLDHDKDLDVLWVGNVREIKRPDRAVALAETLLQQTEQNQAPYTVHVVGGPVKSEETLFEQLKQQADAAENLYSTGYLSPNEVEDCYRRAKVFVNTSIGEGFPNTYLQAWSKGVPVVTYLDVDNMIQDHQLGYVVSSAEEMYEKVHLLLNDEALRRETGERCIAFMRETFSNSAVANAFLKAVENS